MSVNASIYNQVHIILSNQPVKVSACFIVLLNEIIQIVVLIPTWNISISLSLPKWLHLYYMYVRQKQKVKEFFIPSSTLLQVWKFYYKTVIIYMSMYVFFFRFPIGHNEFTCGQVQRNFDRKNITVPNILQPLNIPPPPPPHTHIHTQTPLIGDLSLFSHCFVFSAMSSTGDSTPTRDFTPTGDYCPCFVKRIILNNGK